MKLLEVEKKIIFLGPVSVGKSSLIITFIEGKFCEYLPSTLGAAYVTKKIAKPKGVIKLHIWDTCG